MGVRDTLQEIIDVATHEEDIPSWEELKERQNNYIQKCLESIGNFNNSVLTSNITYLVSAQ